MDTYAVDCVVVLGTYWTMMVHVEPGLTTFPEAQVPPVIENVPFAAPAVVVIVGAAVSVIGAAEVPVAEFMTVTVPIFVVRLFPFNPGDGPDQFTVAPCTVNATELVVPFGVTTAMLRLPVPAVPAMVSVAVACVALTTVRPLAVAPVPETVTAVAPVRPLPVRVMGTAVPRKPAVGATVVNDGARTVNATLFVVPAGVVTVIL